MITLLIKALKKPSPYRNLFALWTSIWFVGFLIGAYAPPTILDDSQVLRWYVSLMSHIADPRGAIGSRSNFPQITALYHAVAVWSIPVMFLIWWRWMNSQVGVSKTGFLLKERLSIGNRLAALLLLPLWIFLAYAGFVLNHGGDSRLFAFGTSRSALAFFGIASEAGAACMLATAVFTVKRLVSFGKKGDK